LAEQFLAESQEEGRLSDPGRTLNANNVAKPLQELEKVVEWRSETRDRPRMFASEGIEI